MFESKLPMPIPIRIIVKYLLFLKKSKVHSNYVKQMKPSGVDLRLSLGILAYQFVHLEWNRCTDMFIYDS